MAVSKPNIVNLIGQIPSTNFGVGRRSPISQISEHHVVGDARHAIDKAKIQGRQFSCTFTIGTDGTIYQLVDIKNTPYTDNDYRSNGRAITIEHAGGHASYPYTDAMYRSSIHLHAWLFQNYGMLSCVRHRDIPEIKADPSKATACPGGLNVEHIVSEAKKLLKGEQEVKIGPESNWRWRMNRLHHQLVRNADMSDNVFKSIVGQDAWKIVESWSSHKESDQLIKDQVLGEKARKENWTGKISDLQKQLEDAKAEAMKLATNPTKEQYAKVDEALKACEQNVDELNKKMGEEAKIEGETEIEKPSIITRFFAWLLNRKK